MLSAGRPIGGSRAGMRAHFLSKTPRATHIRHLATIIQGPPLAASSRPHSASKDNDCWPSTHVAAPALVPRTARGLPVFMHLCRCHWWRRWMEDVAAVVSAALLHDLVAPFVMCVLAFVSGPLSSGPSHAFARTFHARLGITPLGRIATRPCEVLGTGMCSVCHGPCRIRSVVASTASDLGRRHCGFGGCVLMR